MPIHVRSRRARKRAQDLHPDRQADLKASIIKLVTEGAQLPLAAGALSVLPSELAALREADTNFERELQRVLALRQLALHKVHQTGTRDERAAALAELERSYGWTKPAKIDLADRVAPFLRALYTECCPSCTEKITAAHDRYLAQLDSRAAAEVE